jgi:hypothetical protein
VHFRGAPYIMAKIRTRAQDKDRPFAKTRLILVQSNKVLTVATITLLSLVHFRGAPYIMAKIRTWAYDKDRPFAETRLIQVQSNKVE